MNHTDRTPVLRQELLKSWGRAARWGGVYAAVAGLINAQVSLSLGVQFFLGVLASWFVICTVVGTVRGIVMQRRATVSDSSE